MVNMLTYQNLYMLLEQLYVSFALQVLILMSQLEWFVYINPWSILLLKFDIFLVWSELSGIKGQKCLQCHHQSHCKVKKNGRGKVTMTQQNKTKHQTPIQNV